MVDRNAREIFVKNLRRYMEERKITQSDISQQLQLTPSTVSDWCNGKSYPRVDAMQRLAAILDVSMRELTTDSEDGYILSQDEIRLLFVYRSLNPQGREKIQSYAADIAMLYGSEKNNTVAVRA